MQKFKCESCGANLEIKEKEEYVTCSYCKQKYKVEDLLPKKQKTPIWLIIILFSAFVIIPLSMILLFANVFNKAFDFGNSNPEINNTANEVKDEVDDFFGNFEINSFNSKYESDTGTKSKFFIESTLDDVVTNNKTNKTHIINVVYNDINTNVTEEIVELKHSLEDKDYEVSVDYDEAGFVNKIVLEDIN